LQRQLAALASTISFSTPSEASAFNSVPYHSYEELVCGDCHRSVGDTNNQAGTSNRPSLHKADITDLCLSCHLEGHNTPLTADLPAVADGGWEAPIVMTRDGKNPAILAATPFAQAAGPATVDLLNGRAPSR
jgi:hypothetical protein